MASPAPNPLVVDAFKPVIEAVLEFDGLWLPDYGEIPERLTREEAELLADYIEGRVVVDPPDQPEHMRSLAALASILTSVGHLAAVLNVLRARCEGES